MTEWKKTFGIPNLDIVPVWVTRFRYKLREQGMDSKVCLFFIGGGGAVNEKIIRLQMADIRSCTS